MIYGLAITFASCFNGAFRIYQGKQTEAWLVCVRDGIGVHDESAVQACDRYAGGYSATFVSIYGLTFLFVATIILFTKAMEDYIANFSQY